MITVRCPECGGFVEDVYEDELPMEFECAVCGYIFVQESEEDDEETD